MPGNREVPKDDVVIARPAEGQPISHRNPVSYITILEDQLQHFQSLYRRRGSICDDPIAVSERPVRGWLSWRIE